jgi:hypothetical protein
MHQRLRDIRDGCTADVPVIWTEASRRHRHSSEARALEHARWLAEARQRQADHVRELLVAVWRSQQVRLWFLLLTAVIVSAGGIFLIAAGISRLS